MASGEELNNMCAKIPGFLGVFASDDLPYPRPKTGCLIVNYDPKTKKGSHWCAMRFHKYSPSEYFDSFGLKPDQADRIVHDKTNFNEYLGPFVYNMFDFQNIHDDTCGYYCVLFCKYGLVSPIWEKLHAVNDSKERDCMARYIAQH